MGGWGVGEKKCLDLKLVLVNPAHSPSPISLRRQECPGLAPHYVSRGPADWRRRLRRRQAPRGNAALCPMRDGALCATMQVDSSLPMLPDALFRLHEKEAPRGKLLRSLARAQKPTS